MRWVALLLVVGCGGAVDAPAHVDAASVDTDAATIVVSDASDAATTATGCLIGGARMLCEHVDFWVLYPEGGADDRASCAIATCDIGQPCAIDDGDGGLLTGTCR